MNATDYNFSYDRAAETVARLSDTTFLSETLESHCRYAAECLSARQAMMLLGASPKVCTCSTYQSARDYS